MAMSWHVWTPKVLSHCAKAIGSSSGSPARISLRFGSRLLSVFSDPAAEELHVEEAIPWDLRQGNAQDRLEPDPLPLVIVETRDLDRLIVVALVAVTPQATNLCAPLTEKVLVVTGGTNGRQLRLLAAFTPGSRPVAAPAAGLAPHSSDGRLATVGHHRPRFFGPRHQEPLPPGQVPDLTLGVAQEEVFRTPLPAWPIDWSQRCHPAGSQTKIKCHWCLSQNVNILVKSPVTTWKTFSHHM